MKRNKSIRSANLMLEVLEDRCVPAGNVAVLFESGVLTVTGDQFDNDIILESGPSPQSVLVQSGDNATTIGGELAPLFLEDVSEITVDLQNGNDVVTANMSLFYSPLRIFTGNGNDEVSFAGWVDSLWVVTGQGSDTVSVSGEGPDFTIIDTGPQHDHVLIQDLDAASLVLRTGDGHDTVEFRGINLFNLEAPRIDLGAGNDVVEGDPADGTYLGGSFGMRIDGGPGWDSVSNSSYFPSSTIFPNIESLDE